LDESWGVSLAVLRAADWARQLVDRWGGDSSSAGKKVATMASSKAATLVDQWDFSPLELL